MMRSIHPLLWLLLIVLTSCSGQSSSTQDRASYSSQSDQDEALPIQQMGGQTMGTQWTLRWRAKAGSSGDSQVNPEVLEAALIGELVRINALMSTWDPQSELSQFNSHSGTSPVALHQDTLNVIDAAVRVSALTAGRYDITLAPVIALWGFSNSEPVATPADDAIAEALSVSGSRLLVRSEGAIRKRKPQLAIDVSSLAKGYAVDKLGELVESFPIEHYLLDIGGELRARGERGNSEPWHVGIENPEGEIEQLLLLRNTHVASSGSYRNFRIENGQRLSHIIDGETGRPVDHNLVSVTVVHDSTMLADAWATALMVVGPEDAQRLIAQQGLAAQLTVFRDAHFERIANERFQMLLTEND